jgi:hypothetical protein
MAEHCCGTGAADALCGMAGQSAMQAASAT